MAMFQDDSTDDETCCSLQLAERLRINRVEHAPNSNTMTGKDLKQFYNQQRQKHILEDQSSSSSSLDMPDGPSVSGLTSAYGLQNKKRQNGDKTLDQAANPKRTCLGDRFQRSSGWTDCKKMTTNGDIPYSNKIVDFSSESGNSAPRSLFPDKTYEDHLKILSDSEESDFEPLLRVRNKSNQQVAVGTSRTIKNQSLSAKRPSFYENQPSGGQGVHFIDSASDDDSRIVMPIGALKGGRQSPDPTCFKKVAGRKVKKVLDSDDSDTDDWPNGYRSRPLIFSSSDSEDSIPSKKANNKSSGIVSKKSANLSFSSGESQKSNHDHSYHRPGQATSSCFNGDSPDSYIASIPSSSDYRTKSPTYKSYKTRSHSRANAIPSDMTFQKFCPISGSFQVETNPSVPSRLLSEGLCVPVSRSLRSHRHVDSNKSKGRTLCGADSRKHRHKSDVGSELYNIEGSSKDGSSHVLAEGFIPHEIRSPYHSMSGNHSRPTVSHSRIIRGSRRADSIKSSKRRSMTGACSQKGKSNLAAVYPDLFDAEDSSEVEFFTANSYSDNESNTDSLNGLRILNPLTGESVLKPDVQRDHATTVGSSEDEISVVFSSGPHPRSPLSRSSPRIISSDQRRGTSRTLGRRYNRGSRRHLSSRHVSLSPDPVEQVRQVEEDERFARMLQAQFDSEVDPTQVPRPHLSPNPCQMNIRETISSDDDSSLDIHVESEVFRERGAPIRMPFLLNNGSHDSQGFPFFRPAIYSQPPNFSMINVRPIVGRSTLRAHRPWTDHERSYPWLSRNLASLFSLDTSEDSYEAFLGLADMNGDVTLGLQKTEINRLPTRKYSTPNSASSNVTEIPHKRADLNKECQVCLNDYVNGDVLRILPCFHEFHIPCIDPWLKINRTCPVCRVIVDLGE